MPKEQIRKRGKRKPKTENDFGAATEVAEAPAPAPEPEPETSAETGGIHPSRLAFLKTGVRPAPVPTEGAEGEGAQGETEEGAADWTRGPRHESEYPFGVLDPDVKAYFTNVEEQIKDWEGVGSVGEEREDRQLFLTSVLSELRGHELQVATDPETAVVLERLLPSLNDWGRRVIGDSFGDNWETLLRHRFGSHVAQTWLSLAAGTLDREARGVYPKQHQDQVKKAKDENEGMLPTMSELITTVVTSILPTLPTLLVSPHASPPIRLLLLVLTPNRALPSLDASREGGDSIVRSKRSGKFRKGQGVQGKSILGDDETKSKGKGKGKEKADAAREVPADVAALRGRIRGELMERMSRVEWQSMGLDRVGSAAVQLLLDVEAAEGEADKEGSLLDILTEGLVSQLDSETSPEAQPYLSSVLVSKTGAHLVEAVLRFAPDRVFDAIWKAYFVGKIGKLAVHPYANFVVGRGVARLDAAGVADTAKEVQDVSGGRGLIKTARTSVLVALAERAAAINAGADAVVNLVKSALDLGDHADALVPALMALKTYPIYEAIRTGAEMPNDDEVPKEAIDDDAEAQASAEARRSAWENRRNRQPRGQLDPNIQGCLLLQALVALPSGNVPVLESLFAQPAETLLAYASSPIASRLLDRVLTSPAVPPKYRRRLYMAFMGHYATLAQDRLGSRVADTVWDTADGYMREKIARSLIPHATDLANSQFGRFLARRLDLHLLQRRPDEWRQAQIGVKHHFAHQKEAPAAPAPVAPTPTPAPAIAAEATGEKETKEERRKRKEAEKDEIDDLFAGVEKKKKKRRT